MKALELKNGRLYISANSYGYITTCSRAAQYYIIEQRVKVDKAAPLDFGLAIHRGLELMYTQPDPAYAINSAVEAYAEHPDDYRTKAYLADVLAKYSKTYKHGDCLNPPYKDANGRVYVEVPFELELGEVVWEADLTYADPDGTINHSYVESIPVVWNGRVDMLGYYDSRLFVVDHKTTSMLGETYRAEFELSAQMHGYTWAMRKLYPSLPIAGILINTLACRKPTQTGANIEFERTAFFYNEAHLDEWAENTLQNVADWLASYKRHYFPMQTTQCVKKWGRCPYADVCGTVPNDRDTLLYSNLYKQKQRRPNG